MEHLEKVINGSRLYFHNEVLPYINGWQKWVIGIGIDLYIQKIPQLINKYKEDFIIKELNLCDENNNIDVEKAYELLKEQAKANPLTINLSKNETLTFTQNDIEKLYNYIKNS